MEKRFFSLIAGLVLTTGAFAEPQYNKSGELLLPVGYDTWVFVGSNLGLSYSQTLPAMTAKEAIREEKGAFHNIYITPEAYESFLNSGTFPDPTILVMEHFVAEDREPADVLTKGVYNGTRSGFEVAVKNASRPDGSSTNWAYYIFTDPNDPSEVLPAASAFADGACFSCHQEHASTDNVWVQFYPGLRGRN